MDLTVKNEINLDKKMNMIFVVQFICSLGVMNGHFLMELFPEYLTPLRTGILAKTILSYLYMGDLNVQLFFVLGGFLLPLSFNDNPKKIINKWIQLFLPAMVLSVIVFAIFVIVFQSASGYTFSNLLDDFCIYILGRPELEEKQYSDIPYILYQLWFLFPFFKTWLVLYLLCYIYKKSELSTILDAVIFVLLIAFNLVSLNMAMGFVFGEIYTRNHRFLINRKLVKIALSLLLFVIPPVIFTANIYSTKIGQLLLFTCVGLLFFCWYDVHILNNVTDLVKRVIYSIFSLGTAIYYVHVPIILFIKKLGVLSKFALSKSLFVMTYIITLMIIIALAYIFQEVIIRKVKRLVV